MKSKEKKNGKLFVLVAGVVAATIIVLNLIQIITISTQTKGAIKKKVHWLNMKTLQKLIQQLFLQPWKNILLTWIFIPRQMLLKPATTMQSSVGFEGTNLTGNVPWIMLHG